jgi:ABC-type nitrate/sulfonate/bicarbonate transport system permease component
MASTADHSTLPRREAGPPRLARLLATVLPPIAVLVLIVLGLEFAKRQDWLPVTVPVPSEIAATFGEKYSDLFFHMAPTVLSAVAGFFSAFLIAVGLGAIATGWKRAEAPVMRFGVILDSIPLIALTPILMVWVGNGITARILIATMAALFPLLVGAVQGFKAIDRNGLELFHVLAASRWQRLTKLAWPSALPYLFAALKIAAPLALLGALIAEWISAERGLGIMMIYALFSFDVPLAWLTILTICVLAVIAYGLVAGSERILVGPPANPIDPVGGRGGHG